MENFVGYDLDAPDDFEDFSDDEDDESFEVYLKPAEVVTEDVWNKPLEHEELYRAFNGTLDAFFLPDEEELKGGVSQISSDMERQVRRCFYGISHRPGYRPLLPFLTSLIPPLVAEG